MKKIIIFLIAIAFLLLLCVECVPAKKYKALEKDYQKSGEMLRNAEHGAKLWEIELQDRKYLDKKKAKLDSLKK